MKDLSKMLKIGNNLNAFYTQSVEFRTVYWSQFLFFLVSYDSYVKGVNILGYL